MKRAGFSDDVLASAVVTAEIRSVLTRRVRAADRFDLDGGMTCQDPAGRDNHGAFAGSFAEIRNFLEAREKREPAVAKFHQLGNLLVERRGEEAFSECYLVAREFHIRDGQPVNFENGARYHDHWQLGDHWRIARRSIVYDWSRVTHASVTDVGGHRSIADPLFVCAPELWGAAPPPASPSSRLADDARQVSGFAPDFALHHEASTLIYALARAYDRGDLATALSCFTATATHRSNGRERPAQEEVQRIMARPGRTFHFIPAVTLRTNDIDAPSTETRFRRRSHLMFDGGRELDILGRYIDEFRREGGRLLLHRRTVHRSSISREGKSEKYWSKFDPSKFVFGSRDAHDPLYTHIVR